MSADEFSIPVLANIRSEAEAYLLMEGLRWDGTPVCPHCGTIGRAYYLTPRDGVSRSTRAPRKDGTQTRSERRVWKCGACRKQFSVLTGTIFHGSKIPLRTWLFVIFEMCASKNGVSAREIERKYGTTSKTAWFMLHRIREAMKREPLAGLLSGTVVADETWIGGTPSNRHASKRKPSRAPQSWNHVATDKTAVVALVNRESGEVRSEVVPNVRGASLRKVIEENVDMGSTVLNTDSHLAYRPIGADMPGHGMVNHQAGEYVRDGITTNEAEGYFSQLKRSIDGTHHHVSVEHLPRYLAEFDYRYTTNKVTDSQRMADLMGRTAGRRLTYRPLTTGE